MTKVRTLMLMFIIAFCGATWTHYKSMAQDNLPQRPNFEFSSNKQFLTNVKQCVDYVYFYNDVEEVNLRTITSTSSIRIWLGYK